MIQFSQFSLSVMYHSLQPHGLQPGFPVHHQLPEPTQTHVHRVSDAIQPSHPLLSPSPLASIFPSIMFFSNEYSGLISFRMNWLDFLAVQWTLKSLLQHHSSKASVLRCSAFFMVKLSYPYMTTGKTIALNRWTFVSKAMYLLFNMLSMFVASIF